MCIISHCCQNGYQRGIMGRRGGGSKYLLEVTFNDFEFLFFLILKGYLAEILVKLRLF